MLLCQSKKLSIRDRIAKATKLLLQDFSNRRFGSIDETLPELFDRIGIPSVLIGRRGQIAHINRAAFALIYHGQGDVLQTTADPFTARTVQSMQTDPFGAAELDLAGRFRRLAFQAVNLQVNDETYRLVILIDLAVHIVLYEPALAKIFGLTAAEGRLAVELGKGAPLAQIASTRNVSVATLRSQLASIFEKTQTSRQPELVALLSRLSQLSKAANATD